MERMIMNRVIYDEHRWFPRSELLLGAVLAVELLLLLGYPALYHGEMIWDDLAVRMAARQDFADAGTTEFAFFSAWLGALPAILLEDGTSRFFLRFPSCAMCVLSIWAVMGICRQVWEEQTALTVGWMLAGSIGFLWYGRLAVPLMAATGAALLTLYCAFRYLEKEGSRSALFAMAILFPMGAWCGGIWAQFAVFPLLIPFLLQEERWKWLLRPFFCMMTLIGILVYFAPFLVSAALDHWQEKGEIVPDWHFLWQTVLMVLERQFNGQNWFQFSRYGHFSVWGWGILPYLPLTVAAFWEFCRNRAALSDTTCRLGCGMLLTAPWLLLTPASEFGALFFLVLLIWFTAAVLCERYGSAVLTRGEWILRWMLILSGSLALTGLLPELLSNALVGIPLPGWLIPAMPVGGAAALLILRCGERYPGALERLTALPGNAAALILAGLVLSMALISWTLPLADPLRYPVEQTLSGPVFPAESDGMD